MMTNKEVLGLHCDKTAWLQTKIYIRENSKTFYSYINAQNKMRGSIFLVHNGIQAGRIQNPKTSPHFSWILTRGGKG